MSFKPSLSPKSKWVAWESPNNIFQSKGVKSGALRAAYCQLLLVVDLLNGCDPFWCVGGV